MEISIWIWIKIWLSLEVWGVRQKRLRAPLKGLGVDIRQVSS